MGETLKRTQILLEPDQHEALTAIAREEGRSMSEVVRELIRERLRERQMRRMEEAARFLLQDYAEDEELTAFTALDGEAFHEEG